MNRRPKLGRDGRWRMVEEERSILDTIGPMALVLLICIMLAECQP
jgi:hypothetical protein